MKKRCKAQPFVVAQGRETFERGAKCRVKENKNRAQGAGVDERTEGITKISNLKFQILFMQFGVSHVSR